MTFSQRTFDAELRRLIGSRAPPVFVVAYSGGLDSSVLLHVLRDFVGRHPESALRAMHVDHGLHPDSAAWARHCAGLAQRLGVPCDLARLTLPEVPEGGLESAARAQRYAALARSLPPQGCLVTAHHADDQWETVLLRLLRGTGVTGLAGIPPGSPFSRGRLLRPLLAFERAELAEFALARGLEWVEDPSNRHERFDRNFLRARVLPRLRERWPAGARTAARAASLCREADGLLGELGDLDLGEWRAFLPLPLARLRTLSAPRRANLLRRALTRSGLPHPGAARLRNLLETLIEVRRDAQALVAWPGVEARCYRDQLYLELPLPPAPEGGARLAPDAVLEGGFGTLSLRRARDGLAGARVRAGLELAFRRGGESIRLAGRQHHSQLKKLLQQAGVPPWRRPFVPLLYSQGELVAVGEQWLAEAALAQPGDEAWRVCWRPPWSSAA